MKPSNGSVNLHSLSYKNWVVSALALVICFGLTSASVAQLGFNAKPVLESDLRAAVIVGILRYTQWEGQINRAQNSGELTICSWGDTPSAAGLEGSNGLIKVQNQLLRFQRMSEIEDLHSCPVVIWGEWEPDDLSTEIDLDTFVICDNCKRRQVNAVIRLVREENRIQIDVDLDNARLVGVSFSSNLLDLARNVEGI